TRLPPVSPELLRSSASVGGVQGGEAALPPRGPSSRTLRRGRLGRADAHDGRSAHPATGTAWGTASRSGDVRCRSYGLAQRPGEVTPDAVKTRRVRVAAHRGGGRLVRVSRGHPGSDRSSVQGGRALGLGPALPALARDQDEEAEAEAGRSGVAT